jgi:mono/diheme cytochrome c family protein
MSAPPGSTSLSWRLGVLAALALFPSACRTEQTIVTPDPHLNRMVEQEKRLPYEEDPALPRGMAMQQPPDGTLAVDAIVGQPLLATGVADGRWAERIPLRVDRALLDDGRARFDVFCATCHGVLGDGDSLVAQKMTLRPPPSLHEARIRAYPPGRVFQTIREGYGLMPSYSVQISVRDGWAIVAYVRALQLARGARVAALPPDVRAQLAREAP